MTEDLSERGYCHFIGGAWRVPHPAGAAADLARAQRQAGHAPGAPLPDLPATPALIRPGAAILLAPCAPSPASVATIERWCGLCRQNGQPVAALSLLQPCTEDAPPALPGWCFIPLFRSATL